MEENSSLLSDHHHLQFTYGGAKSVGDRDDAILLFKVGYQQQTTTIPVYTLTDPELALSPLFLELKQAGNHEVYIPCDDDGETLRLVLLFLKIVVRCSNNSNRVDKKKEEWVAAGTLWFSDTLLMLVDKQHDEKKEEKDTVVLKKLLSCYKLAQYLQIDSFLFVCKNFISANCKKYYATTPSKNSLEDKTWLEHWEKQTFLSIIKEK